MKNTPSEDLQRLMWEFVVKDGKAPDRQAGDLAFRYAMLVNDTMGGQMQVFKELPSVETHTSHGVCISPKEASDLLNRDKERTRSFILGLWTAVWEVKLRKPGKRVEVLYVGTGPFAGLALPVAAHQGINVAVHAVDIHQASLDFMDRTVLAFGVEEHFPTRICADASTLRLEDHLSVEPDIIVAECMNIALLTEPQAAIMLNLLPQLPSDVLVIPERIEVKLGFQREGEGAREAVPFFDLSKRGVTVDAGEFDAGNHTVIGDFEVPESESGRPWRPYLETGIQVFGSQVLAPGDCFITGPVFLPELPDKDIKKLKLAYRLGALKVSGLCQNWE